MGGKNMGRNWSHAPKKAVRRERETDRLEALLGRAKKMQEAGDAEGAKLLIRRFVRIEIQMNNNQIGRVRGMGGNVAALERKNARLRNYLREIES